MSPPVRAVWMTLEEMGLSYKKNVIDLMTGAQKSEDFKKINPRQKVPALKDGDFCLGESRAIAAYLVNQYGVQQGKQSLYPTDPQSRATIDQQLYISENTVEQVLSYANVPGVLFRGEDKRDENLEKAKAAVRAIEDLLTKTKYTAGNEFTLADIFYYMAIGFLEMVDFDWCEFPKVSQWRAEIATRPYYNEVWAEPQANVKEMYNSRKGTKA